VVTTTLIIIILNYSEVNAKVLNIGIETTRSNNYKEISEDNRDTNSILAII